MKRHAPLALAAFVFLASTGALAAWAATPACADWYGPGPYGPPPGAWSYGYDSPHGYGGHGGYGHAGFDGPPCGRGAYLVERMDRFMGRYLDLTEDQEAAWKAVVQTADAARDKVEDACGDRDDWKGTAPERLARMEAMMSAGAEALHDVRPKFDAFYATLTDRQKQQLDDVMVHRHGRMSRR
jgi:hypothetical protein